MMDKVLPTPVVLCVGDVLIEGDEYLCIVNGTLMIDTDTGAYLRMEGWMAVGITEDDAIMAWESGKQVFENAPDEDFIGLWIGC